MCVAVFSKEALNLFEWKKKPIEWYLNIALGAYLCVDREKDEDEGVPSETEEDRRQQENRAKEIRGEVTSFTFVYSYLPLSVRSADVLELRMVLDRDLSLNPLMFGSRASTQKRRTDHLFIGGESAHLQRDGRLQFCPRGYEPTSQGADVIQGHTWWCHKGRANHEGCLERRWAAVVSSCKFGCCETLCVFVILYLLSACSGEPAHFSQQWCRWSRPQCSCWPDRWQRGTGLSAQKSWDIRRLRQSPDEQQQE